jgi:hypothetical protein
VLRGPPKDEWVDRGSPALAWAGDRLFVYGGNPVPGETENVRTVEPLNDAALIDPDGGKVDVLPEPPFDRPLRVQPAVVAVDDEILVIGQLCPEADNEQRACGNGAYRAAVFSVEDRRWREIELPGHLEQISNGQSEPVGATSDGRAVVILGARGGYGALANRELWTYSLADDEWEQLPSPGALIEGACLADDAVVVGSGLITVAPTVVTDGVVPALPVEPLDVSDAGPTLRVMALDGEVRAWFPTEPAGVLPTADTATMTCGDDLVLVDDGTEVKRVFQLGPGGGWHEAADQPGDDVHTGHLWTGDEFLFLDPNSPTLAYDPEADSWRGIEGAAPTGTRSVWTGELVVGWPGRTDLPVAFPVE